MINIIAKNRQKLYESQRLLGGRFEMLVRGKFEQFGMGEMV